MDIAKTTEPRSDQMNFDDFAAGPKTVTVTEVKNGSKEQPIEVHLKEFPGRPFKPSKSMRRVLVHAWGPEASVYSGRQMTLYGDPTVMFGGQQVGGIRISHLSHIPETLSINLTVTRGRRAPFVVEPLVSGEKTDVLAAALQGAKSVGELQSVWARVQLAGMSADAELVALKDARKQQFKDATAILGEQDT